MVKPKLPPEVANKLPVDIVRLIYKYVPHLEKSETPKRNPSPQMEKDLRRIQLRNLRGKNEAYLRELEDFLL